MKHGLKSGTTLGRPLFVSPSVVSHFHFDASENVATVVSTQDVEPILDHNKALQTHNDGYSPSRELRRIASIPLVVWDDLMKRGIAQDTEALKKWLRDPENRYFRTSEGRF